MSDSYGDKSQASWRESLELPEYVVSIWKKQSGEFNPVSIVATVDEDGCPRTAPFGSLRAITPNLLRLLVDRRHDTLANIVRDGRVSVTLLSPPRTAVSVQGRARLLGDADRIHVIVEVEITKVKNDRPRTIDIESGVTISASDDFVNWWKGVSPKLGET
ncbi:MAG: pyridoxamine 5'-phosphate oxidase family protein [Candidatus Thorarchaeota archaeon]|jgi:flavin reductase (DIM6/NTAB) family NADH-FMN oxidoreductase RutF